MNKKRIGLLHGAMLNSGDFLIFNRGKKLLKEYLDSKYDLVDIKRWEPFDEELDVLIILGGPLISRKLHPQSKIIGKYLKNKEIPVVCLGLGISGERFPEERDYFTTESSQFWKGVYQSSHLFSVRDKKTLSLLKHNGIDAELTGCPALYDLDMIKNKRFPGLNLSNHKIAVTIPQIIIDTNPLSVLAAVKNIFLTITFIYNLKSKIKNNPNFLLILQHGYTVSLKLIEIYAIISGFEILDVSNRGLDEVDEIEDADFHVGTRLHSHILFLSRNKPSYLLNVDNRTKAFLENFNMEGENYSLRGIIRLSNKFSEEISNPEELEENISQTNGDIMGLYEDMKSFLIRINDFLETV